MCVDMPSVTYKNSRVQSLLLAFVAYNLWTLFLIISVLSNDGIIAKIWLIQKVFRFCRSLQFLLGSVGLMESELQEKFSVYLMMFEYILKF